MLSENVKGEFPVPHTGTNWLRVEGSDRNVSSSPSGGLCENPISAYGIENGLGILEQLKHNYVGES